jgi:hypothetical protein
LTPSRIFSESPSAEKLMSGSVSGNRRRES